MWFIPVEENLPDFKDSFDGLYSNAWNEQTLDKFIVKIRYKF